MTLLLMTHFQDNTGRAPVGKSGSEPGNSADLKQDLSCCRNYPGDLLIRTQELMEAAGGWMAEEPRRHLAETAKEWFFDLTGRVNEDDSTFERRMSVYLEFLLFVWVLPGTEDKHPWELFVRESALSPPDLELAAALDGSHWSIFELLEKNEKEVYLSDLLLGGQWRVRPEGAMLGVEEGDVFHARVFAFKDNIFFTQAFMHHPSEARHLVKKIIEKDITSGKTALETAGRLAHMHLKFDRYRRMNMLQIYSIDP